MSSQDGTGVTEIEILEVVGLEEDGPERREEPEISDEPVPASRQAPAPRHSEMRERGRLEGTVVLLRELLPALDDLERCVRSRPDHEQLEQGVKLALRGLWDVFRRRELERIEGEGRPFDPAIHEAVSVTPTDRVPPSTVIELLRVGYRLGSELVRPALVRVSCEPVDGDSRDADAADSGADDDDAQDQDDQMRGER